jgi:hypothetical protein
VLARHANAKVTGQFYAGVSEQAKAKIASKPTDAGFGSQLREPFRTNERGPRRTSSFACNQN